MSKELGLSGCKLEIISDSTIRKYSSNKDYNSRLFDRKIKAFDSYDINNNDIDVYYEKGEKPIKVIDFKNRYYE
jgi:hypothetical protein